MGDGWLDPGTCGVKLAEFERMTQQLTRAAPELAELAHQLWQALNGAKVSTAPAMEIKRIAAWADQAAADLRRRNQLAHQLDRQRLAFVVCRPDGNYVKLPDRYTDQVAYAAGRRSADLFRRAADGDAAARAALRRIQAGDVTPMFAKGLLEALGPKALLELPMDLTLRLAGDIRQHRDGVDANAAETRALLAVLGKSLALATRPGTDAYLGDEYLHQLTAAGRTNFPPLSSPPNGTTGYQALSTLLTAAGDTRFSTAFLGVVGNDMVVYDSQLRKRLGELPHLDLASKNGLGNALDPTTTKVDPTERKTDFLSPLLTAAALSGREGAQAILLKRTPMGPFEKGREPAFTSALTYLLHDRRPVWAATDHGAALGKALQTAATGQDKESKALAFTAAKILANDARKHFVVKDGKLIAEDRGPIDSLWHGQVADAIARPKHYDELSGLRPAMATVLVAHMEELHSIVLQNTVMKEPNATGLTGEDLDYLLLDVTRDAGAYEKLLMGQIVHAKIAIDRAVAEKDGLSNAIAGEGRVFGHILEARHQSVGAEEARLAEDLARMRKYVGVGVGVIPIGQAGLIERVPVAGPAVQAGMLELTGKLTDVVAKRLADDPDQAIMAPTTETETVEQLFNQMIVSAMATQGRLDGPDLAGRTFATEGPNPTVRPVESMSSEDLSDLIMWANDELELSKLSGEVQNSIRNGQEANAGHYKGSDGKSVSPIPWR